MRYIKLNYHRVAILLAALAFPMWIAGCDGDPEVTKLINDLRDDDPEERHDAAKALEDVGKRAAPAVPTLAKCLSDDDEKVRYRSAKTLAKIGLDAQGASIELGHALANDENAKVKYYAAKALDEIADHDPGKVKATIPNLLKALNEEDPKTRCYVLKTLAKIGADAHDAIGEIEKLVDDADKDVRRTAESALRRIKKKFSESSKG